MKILNVALLGTVLVSSASYAGVCPNGEDYSLGKPRIEIQAKDASMNDAPKDTKEFDGQPLSINLSKLKNRALKLDFCEAKVTEYSATYVSVRPKIEVINDADQSLVKSSNDMMAFDMEKVKTSSTEELTLDMDFLSPILSPGTSMSTHINISIDGKQVYSIPVVFSEKE